MTITKTQQAAIAAAMNEIAHEDPITWSECWTRVGTALGYEGQAATDKGRRVINALQSGALHLEVEASNETALPSGTVVTRFPVGGRSRNRAKPVSGSVPVDAGDLNPGEGKALASGVTINRIK